MSRKSDPPPGKPTVDLLQTEDLESATVRKVAWRLVPFLCLIYVVAFDVCHLAAPLRETFYPGTYNATLNPALKR